MIANEFALGYTYQDVLDADQDGMSSSYSEIEEKYNSHDLDILARLSIYFLSESSPAFARLLKPLLTPLSIPETLLVLLLDWSEPWLWARQIRDWIIMLQATTSSLGDAPTQSMEQTMNDWQQRRRRVLAYDSGPSSTSNDGNVVLPLSQGEWDEPLGLPLCVVCFGVRTSK